jgi:hypothetical protein
MEKKSAVNLTVNRPLHMETGVTLEPGVYPGTSKQLGFPRTDDVVWTAPEYALQLGEAELRQMGNKYLRTATYDVTKYVKHGDISVAEADAQVEKDDEKATETDQDAQPSGPDRVTWNG